MAVKARTQFAKITYMKIKSAIIYLNRTKEQNGKLCAALEKTFDSLGIQHYVADYKSSQGEIKEGTDLAVCLGGDGTLLRAARAAAGTGVKVIGINSGSLGFLSASEATNNFTEIIEAILKGNVNEQERMLLGITITRNGQTAFTDCALNECVIKTCQARAVTLSASYAGEEIKEFFGDGLIISTPTGSTAYNLAAGGPIAYPTLDAFILTPICPHTLAQRPLVLPAHKPVTIQIAPKKPDIALVLSLDGQINFTPNYGDTLTITKNKGSVCILYPKGYGFFNTLTAKLKWGSR